MILIKSLKEVFYPPIGIAHITKNLTDLLEYRIDGKERIILNTSSQPNSSPHLGTITTLMCVFSLAKKFKDELGIDTTVQFDQLENSPYKTITYDDIPYCISLSDALLNGKALSEIYMDSFKEILDRLQNLSGINYSIRTYNEFQEKKYLRKSLIKILNNKDKFEKLLSPSDKNLHIRIKCPICKYMDKYNKNLTIKKINDDFYLESYCPNHGHYSESIKEADFIDINTQLRDLMKGLLLLHDDSKNNTLTIMVDGDDWAGTWDHRIHCEGLTMLRYSELPMRLFTPIILDWSGAKFSKSLYLTENAYSNQNQAFNNYNTFYETYGEKGIETLWKEINTWTKDSKKFFRNYSVEYFDMVLNH